MICSKCGGTGGYKEFIIETGHSVETDCDCSGGGVMTERLEQIRWRVNNGMYAYYASEDIPYLLAQLAQAQEIIEGIQQDWGKTCNELAQIRVELDMAKTETVRAQAENARLRELLSRARWYVEFMESNQMVEEIDSALAQPEGDSEKG